MDQEKYRKMFIREARENLDVLNSSLLKLEKKPSDKKTATELMRAAHTLKSSSAAMGYKQMSQLTHAIEDIFDAVRSGKAAYRPDNSDVLFSAFDLIDKGLQEIKTGGSELDATAKIAKLKELHEAEAVAADGGRGEDGAAEGAGLAERPETIRPLEEIKVDIETLDTLMNLSEELLVNKMRLTEIADKKQYEELPVALDVQGRLVADVQYNVMQARMVPLGQIFGRFPRMVRDLASSEKKDVNFETTGGDIELDRTVIDKIGEPLVHLLRNAVDHGIVEAGTISLSAKREKNSVIIEVANDGEVIDVESIKEAAIRKRIVNASQAQRLSPAEAIDLIYHAELSTARQVTETSGRGIGLNVVKTKIESLGGTVSVESPLAGQDRGAKFTLTLPLTIAIIEALLVNVAKEIYAIPITNVDRSVKVQPEMIKKVLDREVAIVNGVDIPLVRLKDLFGLTQNDPTSLKLRGAGAKTSAKEPTSAKATAGRRENAALVVIIKKSIMTTEGQEVEQPIYGLVVDALKSEQDIVIKPLTGILKQNPGFAGITILGDGKPALILDVATLV